MLMQDVRMLPTESLPKQPRTVVGRFVKMIHARQHHPKTIHVISSQRRSQEMDDLLGRFRNRDY